MNRRLMQEANGFARKIIGDNLFKMVFITIISCLPIMICGFLIAEVFPIIDISIETATFEDIKNLNKQNISMQLLFILAYLVFYPITISSNKMFLEMMFNKKSELLDLFDNYSSIKKIFNSFKLFFNVMIKTVLFCIPYVLIFSIITFVFSLAMTLSFSYIFVFPYYLVIFQLIYRALGKYTTIRVYENLCFLNYENEKFSKKECYQTLCKTYKSRKKDFCAFAFSFAGMGFLAYVLSVFTGALSLFIFFIYFRLSTTYYFTKHNREFIPENLEF